MVRLVKVTPDGRRHVAAGILREKRAPPKTERRRRKKRKR